MPQHGHLLRIPVTLHVPGQNPHQLMEGAGQPAVNQINEAHTFCSSGSADNLNVANNFTAVLQIKL